MLVVFDAFRAKPLGCARALTPLTYGGATITDVRRQDHPQSGGKPGEFVSGLTERFFIRYWTRTRAAFPFEACKSRIFRAAEPHLRHVSRRC